MPANTIKYQQLTNEIIKALDSKNVWESGISGLVSTGMPINHIGNYYSGINILLLWVSAKNNSFTSNQWITYKQAQSKDLQVKKGSKGTKIIFYTNYSKENKEGGETKNISVMKIYTVFNMCQLESFEADEVVNEWDSIEMGEQLYLSSECDILMENTTPCYSPSNDNIKLPEKTNFKAPENYYTTLAHEMCHSTGHKSRLNRLDIKNKRGYAFEELVAELGAVFTCSKLGIKGSIENHASYLKSWLKAMESDVKYIFQAATLASKASDYLINNIDVKEV